MRLTWLNLVILPSSSHTNSEIRRMLSAASMTTCLSLRSSAQANGSAKPCCWTASRLNFLLGAKVSDASAGSGFPWGLLFDNLRFQPRRVCRVCLLDTSHRRHTLPLDQQNTFSVLEVDVRTPRVHEVALSMPCFPAPPSSINLTLLLTRMFAGFKSVCLRHEMPRHRIHISSCSYCMAGYATHCPAKPALNTCPSPSCRLGGGHWLDPKCIHAARL